MSGNEPGGTGPVAIRCSTRCALRWDGGRQQHLFAIHTSLRETRTGCPDEQLYLSTLPMNGCFPPQSMPMASA